MPKYNVMVECRNAGGTDLHCWRVDASNPGEAGYIATQLCPEGQGAAGRFY